MSVGPCRAQCPLKVWILELVSKSNFSCIVLAQQVLVSRNIWLQVNTLNIVWDPFGAVSGAVLYTGDQTHIP